MAISTARGVPKLFARYERVVCVFESPVYGSFVMVLVGALSTVAGMFINSRIPRLSTTPGYDPRFSGGHFGIFIACDAAKAQQAEALLREHGAVEVRREA